MLLNFVRLVLRQCPPLLGWTLGVIVFALLNSGFHHELWPHTPLARPVFITLLWAGLLTLPWLAARVAWRLADAVASFFWQTVWRLAAVAGYGGAVLSSAGGVVAMSFMWAEWISSH
ncbi:hypothetical protein [Hymenobacter persicinus]|uniref:Uncharacterized protein n=1 Tax=Hymenobacter persicinus TaxID=2025506 RepID=A0A4Q5LDJ0_9BACT|nr:hypothetical protein [Hymenobacter persicinus]RYU79731.1 hypothetical protein EWM57_09985 [Hymenobacter persicinus]